MEYKAINLVKPSEATGEVKEVYDEIVAEEGPQFLVPLWGWFAHRPKLLRYVWKTLKTLEVDDGPTPRRLICSVALIVSTRVGCERCINFHEENLKQRLEFDQEYIDKIKNFEESDLPEKEKVALRFGIKIGFGEQMDSAEFKSLRDHGYTDEQITEIGYVAIFEAGLARHAAVLAAYEDGFDWPEENIPSSQYKNHIA